MSLAWPVCQAFGSKSQLPLWRWYFTYFSRT